MNKNKEYSDTILKLITQITGFILKKYFAFVALLIIIVFTFTGQEKNQNTNSSTYPVVTVECKNVSIPKFTLDYDANPSEEEKTALCHCISNALMGWEKETAHKLATGKKDDINAIHIAAFPAMFGKRISQCGGEKL